MDKKRAGSIIAREIIQELKDPGTALKIPHYTFCKFRNLGPERDKENSCKVMKKPEDRNLQLMQFS